MVVSFLCFFKQKTAYDMRISDWSSDVCSSDLVPVRRARRPREGGGHREHARAGRAQRLIERRKSQVVTDREAERPGRGVGHHRRVAAGKRRRFAPRAEERRVGKEGGSTCRSRWSR